MNIRDAALEAERVGRGYKRRLQTEYLYAGKHYRLPYNDLIADDYEIEPEPDLTPMTFTHEEFISAHAGDTTFCEYLWQNLKKNKASAAVTTAQSAGDQ